MNPDMIDFSSDGFNLLWENEKDINPEKLKVEMCQKSELKDMVVASVPDAEKYYENNSKPNNVNSV